MAKKLGSEIKLPEKDYMNMTIDERREVCLLSIQTMVENINLSMGKKYTNPDIFIDILQTTLKNYEAMEEYEACFILNDMIKMMDEL